MYDSLETIGRYRAHVNAGLARLASFSGGHCEVRSEGSLVYDEEGHAYLDCGGYGVFLLGHRHPRVCAAVKRQIDEHPLATRILLSPTLADACEALARVSPAGLDYACLTNSGAESTELALKLARLAGKRRVISTVGGYHGKTLGALSVTGRAHYRRSFEPLLPDVEFVPYGSAKAVEEAASGGAPACLIVEPVQGEGGVVVPPPGYLRELRRICHEHDVLFVLDEIQTGLGRLGTWWGADREDVCPDVLLVGKGLSGGVVPVAAVVATAAAFAGLNRDPLLHSSTFGGSPIAAAAARAAIETIEEEDIVSAAAGLGELLRERVEATVAAGCGSLVREVRGAGLLIGIEFEAEHLAGDFFLEMLSRRVILSHSLNAQRVVRLTPPATLSEAEVEWLCAALTESAAAVADRYAGMAQEVA
jgi:putrescine aminotransferase